MDRILCLSFFLVAASCEVIDSIPPGQILDFSLESLSSSSVTVTWQDPTDDDLERIDITYFFRDTNPSTGELEDSFTRNRVVEPGVQSLTIGGLTPGAMYFFSATPVDLSGNPGPTSELSFNAPELGV